MSIERELQQKMDVEKWLESETRHFDMCGSYDYCAFCDKSEETPCANAYLRMTAQNDAQEAEPEPSYDYPVEGDTEGDTEEETLPMKLSIGGMGRSGRSE